MTALSRMGVPARDLREGRHRALTRRDTTEGLDVMRVEYLFGDNKTFMKKLGLAP